MTAPLPLEIVIPTSLTEIIARAGLPAGTFNMVMGPGGAVGDQLVGHPDVAAVSFTGSVEVGQGIAARVLANRAKLQMEMGSKNPMLIMDDCDLDLAVAHACNAAFGGTGFCGVVTPSCRPLQPEPHLEPRLPAPGARPQGGHARHRSLG